MHVSKRKKLFAEKYDGSVLGFEEAVKVLKELGTTKFKSGVDIALNLGIDPKKESVRGATVMPAGTGKSVKIAVFAQGADAEKAKEAGADYVGFDDLAEQFKTDFAAGKMDVDVVIATPAAMRVVGQLGRLLGTKGIMPNPKTGTVTPNVEQAVKNAKSGQVAFKVDKAGWLHARFGLLDFDAASLRSNIEALLTDVRKAKPSTSKGIYMRKLVVSSTMGPGIPVDLSSLNY